MHNRISQILVSLVLIVLALQIGINAAKTIAKQPTSNKPSNRH